MCFKYSISLALPVQLIVDPEQMPSLVPSERPVTFADREGEIKRGKEGGEERRREGREMEREKRGKGSDRRYNEALNCLSEKQEICNEHEAIYTVTCNKCGPCNTRTHLVTLLESHIILLSHPFRFGKLCSEEGDDTNHYIIVC